MTVIGAVEQTREPGVVRIDRGPGYDLLGTDTDHSHEENHGDVVLISGDVDEATRSLKLRVRWLGGGGLTMILAGQVVSFWLSTASPSALLG